MKNILLRYYKLSISVCFTFLTFISFSSCKENILVPDYSQLPEIEGTDSDGNNEDTEISENTVLAYIENEGNELWANDKFRLKVKYLNGEKEVTEPVSIKVSLIDDDDTQLNPADYFSNFPEALTFSKNMAESEEITVNSGTVDRNITFLFSVDEGSPIEILNPEYRTFLRPTKVEGELPSVMDECAVYARPDKEFRSSVYEGHTGLAMNMKVGNPHPNANLASQGWKFYTAHEFHRYDALPNNEFPDNPQPRGFEKYKNYHMQLNSTFTMKSTTRVSGAGHLEMWARRNENNRVDDEDFLYFPMGRSDFLANYPNPDMTNNWEVGGMISDAPHVSTHWADFRPGMRIEIRMRLENQTDIYNPSDAIWFVSNRYYTYDGQNGDLWPFLNWPSCGEIDLLETQNPKDNVMCSTIHSLETSSGHASTPGYYFSDGLDYTKYNIYWMEWTTNEIKFGINDKVYGVVNGGAGITMGRDRWEDEDLWAPFTDAEITGTQLDWDRTWFTNPHGFRLILNLDMQKRDLSGNESWTGWDKTGPNDVDNYIPDWINEQDPNKLPKMDIDWIRCYYDESKGFKGRLLCPGGSNPQTDLEEGARPQAINY